MVLRITKCLITLVIALMIFECVNAAFIQPQQIESAKASFHEKNNNASVFSTILCERAEEEEKSEQERDRFVTIEIADFSQIAIVLSEVHTPVIAITPYEHRFDIQPSLFKRYCVYLI
jgi:hypothetical protein